MEEKMMEDIVGICYTQLCVVRSIHCKARKEEIKGMDRVLCHHLPGDKRESRDKDESRGKICCCHLLHPHLHLHFQCVA